MAECEILVGVYAIVNNVTGDRYIGSSANIMNRWYGHLSALRKGRHENHLLQEAWRLHGESAFQLEILEIVPSTFAPTIRGVEQQWMEKRLAEKGNQGYNRSAIACGWTHHKFHPKPRPLGKRKARISKPSMKDPT